MPLFETIPINKEEVAQVVQEHWGVKLGYCIKESQNHTFLATSGEGESQKQLIVRVTPDPDNKRNDSTRLELSLLDFLDKNNLPVCPAIPSQKTKDLFIRTESSNLIIVVFKFASGEPVVYTDWKWMTEEAHVVGLGRWIAKLHALNRRFAEENPSLVSHARYWTELHDGVLKEVNVDQKDIESSKDPTKFNIIHGDINPSNYYWLSDQQLPCMFDWDQLQKCWLLYDLSSPIFSVVMLQEAGSPVDFKPVPQADVKQYTEWLITGYESESGSKVDREELDRMNAIRRKLYKLFCSKALAELDPNSFMGKFCKFINDWLSKDNNQ